LGLESGADRVAGLAARSRDTFRLAGSRFDFAGTALADFAMPTQQNPQSIAAPAASPARPSAIDARGAIEAALATQSQPACRHAFVRSFAAQARAAAAATDALHAAGAPLSPLAGWPVSVKDLFDVQGVPTTAGSAALADAPPAAADAPAVARLRAAGAALVGHTNLSEFAFSGVGINPHHGTPANPAALALDTATPRAPGGSTSGGATSVAAGAARAALGSDTGGSIRIPAALQGLVGFKNTQRLVPMDGCFPLSPTLDTVCAITRDVADAVLVHAVLSARRPRLAGRPLAARRLAVPRRVALDALDASVARAFDRSLAALRAAGANLVEIDLPELADPAGWLPLGSFPAAESWHAHRARLSTRSDRYDPRVALRIRRGETMSAADLLELARLRADWIARMARALEPYDALLSPTVPIVAPALAPILPGSAEADERFFATNALLLRNPSLVNLLDGCALSLPCQAPDELPVGLMIWAGAMADDTVLDVGLAAEAALRTAQA
jgi:amidase/aspartyl-tRNA(Asn)/glutamyl-tRNA(Gln) amidotransferase subunit A